MNLRDQWRGPGRLDIILASLAAPTYFGYYWFTDPWVRGWIYYAATGVLVTYLAWCFRPATSLGALARAWVLLEAGQQGACGALTIGAKPPDGRDVCVQYVGEDGYRAVLALAVAGLIVGVTRWQNLRRP